MPDEPRDESEDKGFNVPVQQKKVIEPLNTEEVVREQGSAPFGPVESEEPSLYKEEPIPVVEAELEPTTMSSDEPLQPSVVEQPAQQPVIRPKRGKKMIIGGVIAAVLVLFGAGSALGYNLWYQNPQKVLGDAIANAMTAKSINVDSTIRFETKPYTPTVNDSPFEGASAPASDGSVSSFNVKADANYEIAQVDVEYTGDDKDTAAKVSGSAILDYKSSDYYVKVNNIVKLVEQFLGSAEQTPAAITSIIEKISGNWVKITDKDIGNLTGETSNDAVSSCVQKVVEEVNTNDSYRNELANLYMKYPILVVSKHLGSKDGMLGYEIEPSIENTNQFIAGFNSSKFYSDVKKCDDSIKDIQPNETTASESDGTDATVSVWVTRWTHELKEVTTSSDNAYSKSSSDTAVNFNQPLQATIPTSSIDLETLMGDIEKAQNELSAGFMGEGEFGAGTMSSAMSASLTASTVQSYMSNNTGTTPTLTQLRDEMKQYDSIYPGISASLSAEEPSSAVPNRIQYVSCGGRKVAIFYFDAATKTVKAAQDDCTASGSSV